MLPMEKFTYRAHAVAADLGFTEEDKPQVSITFEIENDGAVGEQITWLGYFSETTDKKGKTVAQRTLESLQYCGLLSDDLTQLAEVSGEVARQLLPESVDIVVEPEEYKGEWKLKVRWVNRPGGGGFAFKKPMRGNDLKAFAAQMKGTLKNMRGPVAPSSSAPRSAAPAPRNGSGGSGPTRHPNAPGNGGDDGIPF
jgi:hypothetical protein